MLYSNNYQTSCIMLAYLIYATLDFLILCDKTNPDIQGNKNKLNKRKYNCFQCIQTQMFTPKFRRSHDCVVLIISENLRI